MILVKELIDTFRPNEGDGIITYIFSSEETKLCSSENYNFVSDIFGEQEVVSWKTDTTTRNLIYGVIDNELYIVCKPLCKHVSKNDYRLLSQEEYEEKIQAWKDKRKAEREEAERKNQEFLESLNDIPDPSQYDNLDLRNLPTTRAITNPLRKAGLMCIGDLRKLTRKQVIDIPRVSAGRATEIEEALQAYGLTLRQE